MKDTIIDPEWEVDKRDVEPEQPQEQDEPEVEEHPQEEPEEDPFVERAEPSKLKQYLGSILSGNILSKGEVKRLYPYMLFVAFLMLVYISNVFRMQQLYRQHDRLALEVKELRAQAMTLASLKMNATKQSRIVKELEERGMDIKESVVPPKVIKK